jgi:hypothetical protein
MHVQRCLHAGDGVTLLSLVLLSCYVVVLLPFTVCAAYVLAVFYCFHQLMFAE